MGGEFGAGCAGVGAAALRGGGRLNGRGAGFFSSRERCCAVRVLAEKTQRETKTLAMLALPRPTTSQHAEQDRSYDHKWISGPTTTIIAPCMVVLSEAWGVSCGAIDHNDCPLF